MPIDPNHRPLSFTTTAIACTFGVLIAIAGCHPATVRPDTAEARPDAAAEQEHAGGCVESVTLADGSIDCVKRLEDLGEGWNCCSDASDECTQGASTRRQQNPDGSSTLVVHCGQRYHPVFCQNSKIGLICTTTEPLP